ncbi:MAG TPA: efflux RND transporter periplasmic adaptor subunit [Candidatus Angelobacter sp.]|nr:efflux RND transporter periplasmic adaptor subunit [Candidatus Angelobacter sp.]
MMKLRALGAIVMLVAAGAAGLAWHMMRDPTAAAAMTASDPAVPVVADAVLSQDVPIYLTGIGAVQAFNTVTIRTRIDGQLDKVAFTEGQDVKAGDLLAQIDPRPLQAQLEQAAAQKASHEAQLADAKLDLQRFSNLEKRGAATGQSVDTQKALVAQLEANIQADQAAIDNANVQLGYTTITAPISGRTGMRLVDQGNIVHATDQTGLVVLAQIEPISLVFTLPEDALPDVARAMAKGPLKVLAFSRDNKSELGDGTLALIDNQIDQTTGTIRLKATFPNKDHALWPGQFVNARLYLAVRHDGITVPAAVVQRGPQGTYAYVIKPDSTVELRPIAVAQLRDGIALIDTGLSAGERVVVDGQYKLRPGARVDAKPAAGIAAKQS